MQDTETTWQFFTRSDAAWKGLLDACASATKSIDFESYILEDDEVGRQFIDLFEAKAALGVKVRIICDMVGSSSLFNSDIPQRLEEKGIHIRFFNPISFWRLHNATSWFFRNHRKLLIVDGVTGGTGGVGIRTSMGVWRDTYVLLSGSVVGEMSKSFENMWQIVGRDRFFRFPKPSFSSSGFNFLSNSPHVRQRFLYRSFIEAIRTARESIDITTPYFIPDRRFFRVVRLAILRGVCVRVLMPALSDHSFVDRVSDSFVVPALKAGIRIFKYGGEVLHAKSMIIDGSWSTVGSSNIDNLSFIFNYEGNVVSTNRKFAAELSGHFEADLSLSHEVIAEEWKQRGIKKRFLEFLFRPLGIFM